MSKKRILFCSEATFLNTGYATYTREILNYLHNTGKYEIAEMASYGERNDPRAAGIPWKYYGVTPNVSCEPKASKQEVDAYHSKGTNQFGEFIFEHVCLDFMPDIVCDIRDFWMLDFQERSPFRPYFKWCFTSDTPVLCKNGQYKNIQDLKIGDQILDGDYNDTFVKNISARETNSVIRLKTSGYGLDINTTSEHPFFVIKNKGRVWCNRLKRYYSNKECYSGDKAIELEANYISIGDMLVFPPVKINIDTSIDYSNSLATLVGYFISEGTCDEYGHIRFSLHKEETEYAEEIKKALIELYPSCKIEERVLYDKNTLIIGINNKDAVKNIWSKFYDSNRYKIMPDWVFNSPIDFIARVVKSMWRGDGCVVKNIHGYNGLEYFTNSKSLSLSLWQSLIRLGIVTNVTERNYNGHTGYRFFVYGENAHKLNKIVDKTNTTKSKMNFIDFGKINKDRAWIDQNGWLIVKITNKEEILAKEIVYDIEVDSDSHTFLIPYKVHNCIMPTVDARPQARQWVATYGSADACFTYSDWAGTVLMDQSGGKINYRGSAPPSAHPAYKPVEDKDEHKRNYGINPEYGIIGTVMRNQRRKLYPDLFAAFRRFLDTSFNKKYYLYCHTSYPDLGWDIPELLQEYQLASHVLFTYICHETKRPFPSLFKGAIAQSPFTGKWGATLSNVKNGAEYEDLSSIINLFDLYVQYANCEGFGLPQVEAAACAVPVMGTDYSAMESVLRQLGGFPIKPKALYKELETGCYRAVPDNELAATMFHEFFKNSKEKRHEIGLNTRKNFEKHFQWYLSGSKWEEYFDSFEKLPIEQTWASPPRFHKPEPKPQQIPPNTPFTDLAKWLIVKVLGEPERLNTYFESRLVRDLMYRTTTGVTGGMYFNESSAAFDGTNNRQEFSFDIAYEQMRQLCERRNQWEQMRHQKVLSKKNV